MPAVRRILKPRNMSPFYVQCKHCLKEFNPEEDGSPLPNVCPECNENLYVTCPFCNKRRKRTDTEALSDGTVICKRCIPDHAFRCHDCQKLYNSATCEMHLTQVNRVICENCAEHYDRCERCHCLVHPSHMHGSFDGQNVCCRCADALGHTGIKSYSYKPEPIFHRSANEAQNSLVLGIELEMDKGHPIETVHRIQQLYPADWIYFKHDGSLTNGCELVTHPISPQVLLSEKRKKMWRDICAIAHSEDMRSHDAKTCGLHIHVNRDFFETSTMMRLMTELKFQTVVDSMFEPMVIFSRRRYNEIEQWAKKPNLPKSDDGWQQRAITASHISTYDRYRAVNVLNEHTIELRLFRGTLKPDTLFATFEFVSGLCHLIKRSTLGTLERLNWYELCDEVIANCPVGSNELVEYLAERELIVKETLKCA